MISFNKSIRSQLIVTIALFAGIVPVIVYIYSVTSHPKSEDEHWIPVSYQPVEISLDLTGHLEPDHQLTLSAPFEGAISTLDVKEGQRVAKGQTLLTLDTQILDIHIRQSLAALLKAKHVTQEMERWSQSQDVSRARRTLATAQISLDDTQKKLLDAQELFTRGIVARLEVDTLMQQLKIQSLDAASARAELDLVLDKGQGEYKQIAEMELTNAQSKYDSLISLKLKKIIVAPFSGVIVHPASQGSDGNGKRIIQVGSHLNEGASIFDLVSTEDFHVIAQVEETDINQLTEGQRVHITAESLGSETLTGELEIIGAKAILNESSGNPNYKITVSLPSRTDHLLQRLRIGMSVNLNIITYSVNAGIVVPFEALRSEQSDGKITVTYKKDKDAFPVIKNITVVHSLPLGVEARGIEPGLLKSR